MRRREFLAGAAVAAGARRVCGQHPDQAKRDRISVMSLDLGRILKSPAHPDDPNRTLDALDLAGTVAERWGIACRKV